MTDTLSRAIAEFFEPLATLEPVPHAKCSPTCAVNHDYFPDVSPKRYWILKTRPEWHWQPRDFVNDPAMTLLLLEKLLLRNGIDSAAVVTLARYRTGFLDCDLHEGLRGEDRDGHIGRAVALAFARANGLKEE